MTEEENDRGNKKKKTVYWFHKEKKRKIGKRKLEFFSVRIFCSSKMVEFNMATDDRLWQLRCRERVEEWNTGASWEVKGGKLWAKVKLQHSQYF